MVRHLLATALLLAATLGTTGCLSGKVHRIEDSLVLAAPQKAEPAARRLHVLVEDLRDERPATVELRGWHAVPVLGLGLSAIPDVHHRPEPTAQEHWFGRYFEGDLGAAYAGQLAAALEASGTFRKATHVPRVDASIDTRRYDYVIRGTLRETPLKRQHWDYGLNAFGIVRGDIIPHLLGLPYARRSVSVKLDLQLVELPSNRVVWMGMETYPAKAAWEGVWWGGKVEGTQPETGLLKRSIQAGLPQTIERLRAAAR
jgi:hypothetical protein